MIDEEFYFRWWFLSDIELDMCERLEITPDKYFKHKKIDLDNGVRWNHFSSWRKFHYLYLKAGLDRLMSTSLLRLCRKMIPTKHRIKKAAGVIASWVLIAKICIWCKYVNFRLKIRRIRRVIQVKFKDFFKRWGARYVYMDYFNDCWSSAWIVCINDDLGV